MNKYLSLRKILLVLACSFAGFLTFAQANAIPADSTAEQYDITAKVEGGKFKSGITRIQTFKDGSYLAIRNTNGNSEYIVVNDSKIYTTVNGNSNLKNGEPIVVTVGYCSVIIFKRAGRSAGNPEVTIGKSQVTARVKCT